jgi:Pentapeptide repeats (8 copies)
MRAVVSGIGAMCSHYRLVSLAGLLVLGSCGIWQWPVDPSAVLAWVRAHGWLVGTLVAFLSLLAAWVVSLTAHIVFAGHRTACLTSALAQLREPTRVNHLPAIAALERIARASPADHRALMELLTAYVRAHAGWSPPATQPPTGASSSQARHRAEKSLPIAPPAPEIQAALTALGRRTWSYEAEEQSLNLRQVDLRGVDLQEAHLEGADLKYSHLEGADLTGAYLVGSLLSQAHLERASLLGTHLEGAYLGEAHLEGATLQGAHLEQAILRGAHLERSDLSGAHLERADLGGADLAAALLSEAHLEGADLTAAIHLTWEQIAAAIIDSTTRLPPHCMIRPAGRRQPAGGLSRADALMWGPLLGPSDVSRADDCRSGAHAPSDL